MTKVAFTFVSVAVVLALAGSFALIRQPSFVDDSRSKSVQIRPKSAREPALQRVNRRRPVAPEPVFEHERPAPSGADRADDGDDGEAEAALMAELRSLGSSDPERALELARDGNARFSTTGAAPERARIVVKSLVALRRFHEARDDARRMVAAYPRTPEALDVERHLLVYPLEQPSREQMQADMRRAADMQQAPTQ